MVNAKEALLRTQYLGMDDVKRGLAIALLAKEHAYLCSREPGNAKSDVVAETFGVFVDKEKQLIISGTRGGGDSQIVGQLSPAAMMNGQYEMIPGGTATNREFVFIDEFDKMNAMGQEAMLQILAQGRFSRAGIDMVVPLRMCVAAGNDTPTSMPVRDRFAVEIPMRLHPEQRQKLVGWALDRRQKFGDTKPQVLGEPLGLEVLDALRQETARIGIDDMALALVHQFGMDYGLTPRRVVKFVGLVQAAANLHSRRLATAEDVFTAAEYVCLVNGQLEIEERDKVRSKFEALLRTIQMAERNKRVMKIRNAAAEKGTAAFTNGTSAALLSALKGIAKACAEIRSIDATDGEGHIEYLVKQEKLLYSKLIGR